MGGGGGGGAPMPTCISLTYKLSALCGKQQFDGGVAFTRYVCLSELLVLSG